MRKVALILASIAIGFLVPLAIVEIAMRLLPVREAMMAVPVNDANPVFHFTPNQTVTWSRGWDFAIVNELHINNAGYVNDQDYDQSSDKPLFAVVGDSYIEAAMVPYAETVQGRLAQRVGADARVYSFAASGAPLSQYLIWAREARRWGAQALAIVVVGNDFDESLAANKRGPGFHHYVEAPDGELTLKRFDYAPAWARELVKRSAILRYSLLNLEGLNRLKLLWRKLPSLTPPAKAEVFVGNTSAKAGRRRIDRSKRAVRAFLRDLVGFAGWRPDQVVFVVDGLRYPTDKPSARKSYFVQMREFFMAEATRAGFEVIDMDDHFFARLARGPTTFEFSMDRHWNGTGHGVAAKAIAASSVFSRWRQSFEASTKTGEPEEMPVRP